MTRGIDRPRRSVLLLVLLAGLLALPAPSPASADVAFEDAVRVTAGSPRAAAIAVSRELYTANAAGAVVLARQDAFPDALGASALTTGVDGPLLLTPPDRLADDTRAEIDRVLRSGGTVHLLGGTAALTPAVERALDDLGYRTPRFAGRDRIETAALVARFVGAGPGDTALLVRAAGVPDREQGWVDSVSCGGWAAASGTPVLLTPSGASRVAPETRRTIEQLGIRRVHVCGGAAAVSPAQVEDLRATGVAVERHAGADRAATAVAVATGLWDVPRRDGRTFLLVPGYGTRFGFGLVAAPLSAALDAPILLVDRDAPTSCGDPQAGATLCYLRSGSAPADGLVAIGGTGIVGDDVLARAARAADLPGDTTPPPVPSGLVAVDPPEDAGQVLEVSWDPVPEPGVTYTLYVRLADGDRLTRANSVAVATTEPRRVLYGLVTDAEHHLAVEARDASGNRSALSPVVSATPTDEVPASPGDQAPTVAPATGGIEVSWVAAPEADVVGYEVQRLAVGPFGDDCDPGLLTGWEDVSSEPIVGTIVLDDDVMSGRSYCYRYRPIDSTGNAPSHSLPNGPVEAP